MVRRGCRLITRSSSNKCDNSFCSGNEHSIAQVSRNCWRLVPAPVSKELIRAEKAYLSRKVDENRLHLLLLLRANPNMLKIREVMDKTDQ